MLTSGAITNTQPSVIAFSQAQFFQADFNYSRTSQYQLTNSDGQQTASYSSAVNISLSITAINVTTGFLAAEQTVNDAEPDEIDLGDSHHRAKGIEDALKNLLKELAENDGLTGKLAKRFFKLVSALNSARGTDTKLGHLDKDVRSEVRSARHQVNDFFRAKHSTVLLDDDLANFITLVAKIETLREFALKTTDLLAALSGGGDDEGDETEQEQAPLINIEA